MPNSVAPAPAANRIAPAALFLAGAPIDAITRDWTKELEFNIAQAIAPRGQRIEAAMGECVALYGRFVIEMGGLMAAIVEKTAGETA